MSLFAMMLAILAAIPNLYLGALGLLASLPRPRPSRLARRQRTFCVIAPAHNEAARIGDLLDSIERQLYPLDCRNVIVVADNCADNTAEIARNHGAQVVERVDTEHRGKGFALEAGLQHLPVGVDAVLFVDGDCTISPNALSTLNDALERGARAIQCRYEMAIDAGSASSAPRRLALALVHIVRPLAKERLHASAGLKGSGMCFDRSLINALGWRVHGLAEDVEQHLALLRMGERVRYEHGVVVLGTSPSSLGDAVSQHERWEAGRMNAAGAAPQLLAEGCVRRSIPMIDAAVELLLPPLSVLGAILVATTGVVALTGGTGAKILIAWSWFGFVLYVLAGIARAGLSTRDAATMALTLPPYALWKILLYVRTALNRPKIWRSTQRD